MARDEQSRPGSEEIVPLNAGELDADQLEDVAGGLITQPGLGPGERCETYCQNNF